jgi:hypothetical protein
LGILHIWAENGSNFRTQYKSTQNLQTLQGYIFRILQHFAIKLCDLTHFSILLLLAVVIYLHLLAYVLKLVYNGNYLLLVDHHLLNDGVWITSV